MPSARPPFPLARLLCQHLGRGHPRPADAELPHLDEALAEALEAARARWPTVVVGDHQLVPFLAERLGEGDLATALRRLRVDELYLVCGCLRGVEEALAEVDAVAQQVVAPAVARLGLAPHAVEEVRQVIREEVLLGKSGKRPGIAGYGGRGALAGWLRVVAARTAMRGLSKTRREVPVVDQVMHDLFSDGSDPEVAYLKQLYRSELKEAVSQALGELSVRERNLIKQSLLDGLSVSALGRLYGVHRATAAKWAANARVALQERTRAILKSQLGVETTEYRSIVRLIDGQLDLTLHRVFDDGSGDR